MPGSKEAGANREGIRLVRDGRGFEWATWLAMMGMGL